MRNVWRNMLLHLAVVVVIAMPLSAISNENCRCENVEIKDIASIGNTRYIKETYMVQMRDGVHLATDVYLPYENYSPHGCILIRTPYNKDDINQYLSGQGYGLETWVDAGWPFVVQDERGYYASEGKKTCFPGGNYYDGFDTMTWIASQDWSNGNIATWGRSWFGDNQYYLAGSNPPNLACQYVGVATPNFHRDCIFQGGELRRHLVEEMNEFQQLGENMLLEICEHENFTLEYWGNTSLENKWQNISVPAIHIGGWYDFTAQGTIDAFMGYNLQGGEGAKEKSKLVMGPWTHTQFGYNQSKTGDLRFPKNQHDTFSRNMFRDMINQYTMDGSDDFDGWPTVSYYVMGDVGDPNATGNEWRYSPIWPIPAEETPFYFHEGNILDPDSPGSYNPITYTYDPTNPVPTLGGQNLFLFQGPKDQTPVESRDDVLLFTSPILTEPLEATGPIKARLFVSSNCIDTDFTVKLTDVYPDGRSILITDGILRMRNRNGLDHWEFMTPGKIYEIEVDLWSTSYIWNTGHQVRVAISSSNSPRFLANPNTASGIYRNTTYNIAKNTLYLDSDHPSCIILPIVEPKDFMSSPRGGFLYIGGREIIHLPIENAVILGKQNIEINTDMEYGIDKVEFYIDDEIRATDDEAPYGWLWDETIFGQHAIKTVAYARSGKTIERTLQVLIFNL